MRISRANCVSLLSAAALAAGSLLGAGAGAAHAASGSVCSVAPSSSQTGDRYQLTNLQAGYPHAAPRINKWAVYSLASEPQGCYGGEYYVIGSRRGELVPLVDGSTSTAEWSQVGFKLPAGMTFAQVQYGDPASPQDGVFIGSVSQMFS
ncbi:hypothetical protein [Streptomyces sp. NPDC008121]|uniref:hypothetical protein n=1 Tax=Streptomyces sp. NPDC008121 TaxID=3364809 RepID=UPI0036EB7091